MGLKLSSKVLRAPLSFGHQDHPGCVPVDAMNDKWVLVLGLEVDLEALLECVAMALLMPGGAVGQ